MRNDTYQKIKVCEGAGCRAWSSDRIARELDSLKGELRAESYQVCRVPCMRKCGGGVAVEVSACRGVQKFRKPEEAISALFYDSAMVPAVA